MRAADTPVIAPVNNELSVMEQRWHTILPNLFTEDGKQHIGAKVRFTIGPFTNIKAGPPVVIKSRDGVTVQVFNVSKNHRNDIETPHKPPTFVTIEGVITAIEASKRTVSIKATKVDVTW